MVLGFVHNIEVLHRSRVRVSFALFAALHRCFVSLSGFAAAAVTVFAAIAFLAAASCRLHFVALASLHARRLTLFASAT
jgi:hypothetical protein